jgi:hypothetical protein
LLEQTSGRRYRRMSIIDLAWENLNYAA